MTIQLKRVYEPPAQGDGERILVDGLWPRGLSREAARIDLWARSAAPSAGLRHFFGHDPDKWAAFRERYFQELDARGAVVAELARRSRRGCVTLLFAAKEAHYNNAVALKEYLERIG